MNVGWSEHLIVAPVLIPLVCGALQVPIRHNRHTLKFSISMVSVLALLAVAVLLVIQTDGPRWQKGMGVYLAANWMAPFGIVLLADRLAALMVLLTALLAVATLLYSMLRWSRVGVHFHSLFLFLVMGLNGAFLTNDLFNLFVFFEVMLAASYGLLLHGYNASRLRSGMHYIAINLVASLLFLIGVALIYASSGTLNMADLAARIGAMSATDLALMKLAATVLAMAFLVKSAMWPLGFWLPATYATASPPVAAMLVLMTKVGAYAILRLWLLVFSSDAGLAAGFGFSALLWGGMATIIYGAAGMLASETPGRMAGYGAIVSSGTLLAVIGYGQPSLVTAGLYYMVGSTLAIAAFVLLIELIERIRTPGAAVLAVTMEAFAIEDTPEAPVGVGIPAALVFLGLSFAACALIITGLPPLSGFIAKFGLFHALLNPESPRHALPMISWILMALILVSGLAAIISMMRFGVRTFWASGAVSPPRLQVTEVAPISALLLVCLIMTVQAGPIFEYLRRTSEQIHRPEQYIQRIFSEPAVPNPGRKEGQP
ncbi:monovalent cation/H+ antiporter subunit D [Noviherbaspirillum sp. Root189]|uniref:monovalent cation/H+ antiporter subunit D n=1 Tax=Noviherbaspirillum sp. Root189 TaxID=1736487 RepID=UPI00070C1B40|nr:monovalent cation/H+ antiporter subunit D [Noviherbaspirillum sp. Root189]KRB84014.1 cation:proton antiporter [Noviherbaspirillum sp. Root189]